MPEAAHQGRGRCEASRGRLSDTNQRLYNAANRLEHKCKHSAIRVAVLTEPVGPTGEPVWAWKCRICSEPMYEIPADYAEYLEDCAYEDSVMEP